MFKLHHIGFLVADIASAAELYVERFGYMIESSVVEDPQQTAQVQFLRLPGANWWFELISPFGATSKLSRALTRGEGLHHMCYEVPELTVAVENLRRRGMMPVAEPAPAAAFPGRQISWLMDRSKSLVELLESGSGPLSLESLKAG